MRAERPSSFLRTYSEKTDPGILTNDGRSFLAIVRSSIADGTSKARLPNNSHTESMFFPVKQLEEVENLVEREAWDSARRFRSGVWFLQSAVGIHTIAQSIILYSYRYE
jgi:hypothetical protein